MEPRHVLACGVGFDELGFDLIQGHGRRVDDACTAGAVCQQLLWYHRAGVQADRAAGQQVPPTDGDQICGARAGAYEVDGHDVVMSARAQVTEPTTTRGCSRRGVGFDVRPTGARLGSLVVRPLVSDKAPASAAASAT